MALIIGLTGTIGTGKSTVVKLLAERGARTCDVDQLVHSLYAPGTPGFANLVKTFGEGIVTASGQIDRAKLGVAALGRREGMHQIATAIGGIGPSVKQVIERWRAELPPDGVGVVEYWGLMQPGYGLWCDRMWMVTADTDVAIERIMASRGFSRDEAARRVATMPAVELRIGGADWVYANNSTPAELEAAVDAELTRVLTLHRQGQLPPSRYPAWYAEWIVDHRQEQLDAGIVHADEIPD